MCLLKFFISFCRIILVISRILCLFMQLLRFCLRITRVSVCKFKEGKCFVILTENHTGFCMQIYGGKMEKCVHFTCKAFANVFD